MLRTVLDTSRILPRGDGRHIALVVSEFSLNSWRSSSCSASPRPSYSCLYSRWISSMVILWPSIVDRNVSACQLQVEPRFTIPELLGFHAKECIMRIWFLMMLDHPRASMKEDVQKIPQLLVKSFRKLVSSSHTCREPFRYGSVDGLLNLLAFSCLFFSLGSWYRCPTLLNVSNMCIACCLYCWWCKRGHSSKRRAVMYEIKKAKKKWGQLIKIMFQSSEVRPTSQKEHRTI